MESTKERVLQTALALFSQNGYEAVSIGDIAGALSIAKSALYKHYAGKRDIFLSILERMRENDASRAAMYDMPVEPLEKGEEAYKKARMNDMIRYTRAQFVYWTQDDFAARFRRLLTIEQYRDGEMNALYHQYLCAGPLRYIEDLFAETTGDARAKQRALAFYAPVFMLYSLYDADSEKASDSLAAHLSKFVDQQE